MRGIIHVHSDYSYDCTVALSDVQKMAVKCGLSFVVQTEHSNHMTGDDYVRYREQARSLCSPDFLMVPGIEYASENNVIHILTFGIDEFWEDLRLFPMSQTVELLSRVRQKGGIALLAHPERADCIARLPPGALDALDGIEVWNGKTDRLGPSPRALAVLDDYRARGIRKIATAGLDLHKPSQYMPVGLEMSSAPQNDADLVRMLREGSFRLFFGPYRWDPSRAGLMARCVALGSRSAVSLGRRLKATGRRLRKNVEASQP
jgi:predicted metal-dependent phosphoesterase TrpH